MSTEVGTASSAPRRRLPRVRFLQFRGSKRVTTVASVYLLLLVVVAIIAPFIAPADPLAQDISNRLAPPFSPGHLLGADDLGRDTFSRLLIGARVAVQAAGISVGVGLALGLPPALVAGLLRGWWDAVLSRVADTLLSFPPLLLAMAIVGVMGPNLTNAMLGIGLVFAPRVFRVVRSAVLGVREETYIEAARCLGVPMSRIVARHVLPNILSPLIVQISLMVGFAILAEASLSYLGLGVTPPNPSWGRMLLEGREGLFYTHWPVTIPGIAISVSVLAANLVGDGLRDSFFDARGR